MIILRKQKLNIEDLFKIIISIKALINNNIIIIKDYLTKKTFVLSLILMLILIRY